jgi:tyrosine-protein phosphatase SIW14
MRHRIQVFFFFLLFAVCACCAKGERTNAEKHRHAFAQKIHIKGISDAGKVNEYLFRGSQPNKEGIAELRKLGVTQIINLRSEFKGQREQEQRQAEALGIRFVTIPGNGWTPPTDEQIAQFFQLIQERPRRRIYVHCWLGGDRSGVFLATFRIAFGHWTPKGALQEMKAFHFKGFWHPAMKSYIRKFPERLATSARLAPYRGIRQGPPDARLGPDLRLYTNHENLSRRSAAE